MRIFKQRFHFLYEASLKSRQADELLNTYFIRPAASVVVGFLYPTNILPIQVVLLGTGFGVLAAVLIFRGNLLWGGIFLFIKNMLDAVDGQLARAKHLEDRRGRFLDSVSDFMINLLVFSAIGRTLYQIRPSPEIWILVSLAFLSLSLRVSYFVFYFVAFLHLEQKLTQNRRFEGLTEADREGDPVALILQKIYIFFYNWQDQLAGLLDNWCLRRFKKSDRLDRKTLLQKWYSHPQALRLSGFLGLGTELTFVILALILNRIETYIWFNLLILNAYWGFVVLYRRFLITIRP